jgi:predicted O-methyltransferase YrrM
MTIANRISRFHDEKGNRVDARGMMYAPLAFATAVLRVMFGYRSRQPTISYRARTVIARLLDSNSRVAEFGSGMSTSWFAGRCEFLLSVENDEGWHRIVSAMIAESDFGHVQYEMRTPDSFSDLSGFPDGSFDFILIDGWDRHGCVVNALPKLRSGGWIYLDNSDKDMTRPDGDLRRAEEALLAAVDERQGTIRYFVDFSPTNFFVEQGLLVRI